jgi:hypothetical protein
MAVNLNKPLRRAGKRKGTDPLPLLAARHLLGGDTYGALNDSEINAIRLDSRWYGDEEPNWPKCWTAEYADSKRIAAITRLRNHRFRKVPGALELADILESCAAGVRCGSHGCPECVRAAQRWLVNAAQRVLMKQDDGCNEWSFNFVMPEGQVAIADLGDAPFAEIMERVRAALDSCPAVLFAVLGIDISVNDDTEKFRHGRLKKGPRVYWQIHIYGLVRASDRQAVWNALRHLFPKAANIYRPLAMSAKPFDGKLKGNSYICKPQGFRHILYFDTQRGEFDTPKKPPALKAREHVHYLLAMHRLGLKNRIAFVGLHPEITKATKTHNRGVRLRRVLRRGRAM